MNYGVVVVGLGGIGLTYDLKTINTKSRQSHSFAFNDNPGFTLLAGVDPNENARSMFENTFELPAYATMALLPKETIEAADAFVISSSSNSHLNVIKDLSLLKDNPWVLCEKPMGISLQEALSISSYLDTNKILINYSRRFSRDLPALESAFKAFLGKDKSMILSCKAYGGTLRTGSHFLDLLNKWFNLDFSSIQPEFFKIRDNDDFLLNFQDIIVNYRDIDVNSKESYGFMELNYKDKKIHYIRDVLTIIDGQEVSKTEINIDQSDTCNAFYELISSQGVINKCSYSDGLNVHKVIDLMKKNR